MDALGLASCPKPLEADRNDYKKTGKKQGLFGFSCASVALRASLGKARAPSDTGVQ